ncbi:MAG: hypothetical protein HY913_01690 [Desulfomonile tiedjei]|nr:hypothetical protein [Desulfomonile tiedjei]
MPARMHPETLLYGIVESRIVWAALAVCLVLMATPLIGRSWAQQSAVSRSSADEAAEKGGEPKDAADKESSGGLSWEMPGRVSIYDLQFGPAVLKGNDWKFLGSSRTFNAGSFGDRLTLMVRFSYTASRAEIPLKFVIRLPGSRQYEETVRLASPKGQYSYHFTIHRPDDFLGSGSVYLYYGFSIVDVLDFTIMPGS